MLAVWICLNHSNCHLLESVTVSILYELNENYCEERNTDRYAVDLQNHCFSMQLVNL